VLRSKALHHKPVGVCVDGQGIALFRTEDGHIGALEDCCPHRRMRLSCGSVEGDRLRCIYHGWTFDRHGAGESPGTPRLHARTASFEAREDHGLIWIKPAQSTAVFPRLDVRGYSHLCTSEYSIHAPLELVLDNFTESEHTATVHTYFGYPLDRLQDVKVEFKPTDTAVQVTNYGPQKHIPWVYRALLGIKKHYYLNDNWTTYFSPLHSVYDYWWNDPVT